MSPENTKCWPWREPSFHDLLALLDYIHLYVCAGFTPVKPVIRNLFSPERVVERNIP